MNILVCDVCVLYRAPEGTFEQALGTWNYDTIELFGDTPEEKELRVFQEGLQSGRYLPEAWDELEVFINEYPYKFSDAETVILRDYYWRTPVEEITGLGTQP